MSPSGYGSVRKHGSGHCGSRSNENKTFANSCCFSAKPASSPGIVLCQNRVVIFRDRDFPPTTGATSHSANFQKAPQKAHLTAAKDRLNSSQVSASSCLSRALDSSHFCVKSAIASLCTSDKRFISARDASSISCVSRIFSSASLICGATAARALFAISRSARKVARFTFSRSSLTSSRFESDAWCSRSPCVQGWRR